MVAVAGGGVVVAGAAGSSVARALVGRTAGAGAPQLLIATASTIKPRDLQPIDVSDLAFIVYPNWSISNGRLRQMKK